MPHNYDKGYDPCWKPGLRSKISNCTNLRVGAIFFRYNKNNILQVYIATLSCVCNGSNLLKLSIQSKTDAGVIARLELKSG